MNTHLNPGEGRENSMSARDPRTGHSDYSFEVASRAEVAAAVAAVRSAQPGWEALGAAGRAQVLRDFIAALARHRTAMLAALVRDTGRVRIANVEIDALGPMLERVAADAAAVLAPVPYRPAAIPGIEGRNQWVAHPVVGVIAPWNFPLLLSMIDTLPALLAGSAVVLKPSEVTPRFVDVLRHAIAEVPALGQVLRVVRGPGSTGVDLVDHVDAVAFTGSVRTGRLVAQQAARRFIPAFLELGGKDPAIVLPSADVQRTAEVLLRGSIAASGQACQSIERIYVHDSIHDAFVAALAAAARGVRFNHPDVMAGHIGPLIFARQADIIREHLADAVAKGARVEAGGRVVELDGGLYCEATVLSACDHGMKVVTEETFGPVMPVLRYSTVEEALRMANDSDYGLSASVFGADPAENEAVAGRLDAGMVSINDAALSTIIQEFENEPFKASGLGRSRMGPAGVARYLRAKAIVRNNYPAMGIAVYAEPNT
ncbi:MAG: aldehyde dehydrogenase family protein [Gammaproteobacteria bacterium]|nr:aldehyde dehydrogenase family protein [Gammaproteobacteria bacterium]